MTNKTRNLVVAILILNVALLIIIDVVESKSEYAHEYGSQQWQPTKYEQLHIETPDSISQQIGTGYAPDNYFQPLSSSVLHRLQSPLMHTFMSH